MEKTIHVKVDSSIYCLPTLMMHIDHADNDGRDEEVHHVLPTLANELIVEIIGTRVSSKAQRFHRRKSSSQRTPS